ncbi:hypothetical protein QR680_011756 [Steinernema hermaphroditum]|uniref:Uncharacterized protein n=1 Tax=Steinernema hermaphroditum TaxID=289476 RepID=A0AA39LZ99_9BILA|nr:hypothetical protein QR680_011756 [Steinernema hermaphroditum]
MMLKKLNTTFTESTEANPGLHLPNQNASKRYKEEDDLLEAVYLRALRSTTYKTAVNRRSSEGTSQHYDAFEEA